MLITLARASGIPARYVSVFAPRVEPQDFHAVAEVFLADPGGQGGTWQLVDATGMADPAEIGEDRRGARCGRCQFPHLLQPLHLRRQANRGYPQIAHIGAFARMLALSLDYPPFRGKRWRHNLTGAG